MNRFVFASLSALLLAGCSIAQPASSAAPDGTTPPEWMVESTAPPQDLVDPITVPGPLTEDGMGYLIHTYLPSHVGEAGSGGDVFCAYELFGWERQTDTATAWLWAYCQEFNMVASEGTGISTPIAIHLAELPTGWVVSFAEQAGMGSEYYDSIRAMFPPAIAKRALEDGPSLDLASIVERTARNTLGG